MFKIDRTHIVAMLLAAGCLGCACSPAAADIRIEGQARAGGSPLANSTVTLWAASAGEPRQLAQTKTGSDGQFEILSQESPGTDVSLYLTAKGGHATVNNGSGDNNPAIALLTVLGNTPPANVVINEMTTIASVWTHNQFIEGTAIKGSPVALRIAAGNVPNFVDLTTGGYGTTMSDALNSAQTPTMANFATLANVLAGCATQVKADACSSVFDASKGPTGDAPADTLAAAESIARYPSYQPERIFALLDRFYPYPKSSEVVRPTPFLPYLTFAPSAWVFPLKFTGGGLSGPGKLMIDSQGNAWAADNFTVGAQNIDKIWSGGLSKLAPNGKPLRSGALPVGA